MRPQPKKRVDTSAAERARPSLNAAFAGLNVPDLPAGTDTPPTTNSEPEEKLWKMGRVVLRKETAHRGGKTVIVVHDFATHLPITVIEKMAKKIRAACGCGGTIKDRTIEVQGDQPAKIRSVLEDEGFQVAGIR